MKKKERKVEKTLFDFTGINRFRKDLAHWQFTAPVEGLRLFTISSCQSAAISSGDITDMSLRGVIKDIKRTGGNVTSF